MRPGHHQSRLWTPKDAGATLVAQYDSAARSSLITSGSLVTTWQDLSGYGNHVTQSTTANKPTFASAAFPFGLAYPVSFSSGGTDILVSAGNVAGYITGSGPRTLFAVYTPVGAQIGPWYVVWGTNTQYQAFGLASYGGSDPYFSAYNSDVSSGIAYATTMKCVRATYNGVHVDLSTNNGPAVTTNMALATAAGPISIGGATWYTGQGSTIYEVLVYAGPMTHSQYTEVLQYLMVKWGMISSIPSGQPTSRPLYTM